MCWSSHQVMRWGREREGITFCLGEGRRRATGCATGLWSWSWSWSALTLPTAPGPLAHAGRDATPIRPVNSASAITNAHRYPKPRCISPLTSAGRRLPQLVTL